MSDIQKFREWIGTFEGLPPNIRIDYADELASTGLFPKGLQEVERRSNIRGALIITNRLNFVLHITQPFSQATEAENAEWVHALQQWVQQQSALRLAPVFGNFDTVNEAIRAENGALHALHGNNAGMAIYAVEVSVTYKQQYGG